MGTYYRLLAPKLHRSIFMPKVYRFARRLSELGHGDRTAGLRSLRGLPLEQFCLEVLAEADDGRPSLAEFMRLRPRAEQLHAFLEAVQWDVLFASDAEGDGIYEWPYDQNWDQHGWSKDDEPSWYL